MLENHDCESDKFQYWGVMSESAQLLISADSKFRILRTKLFNICNFKENFILRRDTNKYKED